MITTVRMDLYISAIFQTDDHNADDGANAGLFEFPIAVTPSLSRRAIGHGLIRQVVI